MTAVRTEMGGIIAGRREMEDMIHEIAEVDRRDCWKNRG